MLSDVLLDTAAQVRSYMAEQPAVYAEVKPQVDALLQQIDVILTVLNTPPHDAKESQQ